MTTHGNPFSWITSHVNRTEHAVTHDAQMASRAVGKGVYEALCGQALLAASMDVGPAGRCSGCVAFLRAPTRARVLNRPSWLSRLCHGFSNNTNKVEE